MQKHGFGVLFGSAPGSSVTMVGNLFAHIVERNPLSRASEFVFVNNVVYDRGTMDVDLQSQDGVITKSSVVGNVFLRGPSFSRDTRPIYVRTNGSQTLFAGSRVYTNDNYAPESTNGLITLTGGDVISSLMQTVTIPVWNTGLTARATANNAVYDRVLKYRRRASDRSRHRRQARRAEREEPQRTGHQLRRVQRDHTLQQERGRLAFICAEHAHADAAGESEHGGVERLHQSRELAAFHGSERGRCGVGPESYITACAVSALMIT